MFLKFLLLTCISFSAGAEILIKPNTVTIVGETHGHPESYKLFQSLIKGYRKNNTCLTVALEINSNQQSVIDSGKVSDIEISSIIDHPAFRNLIDDLIAQKNNGACLKLLAIDGAGDDIDMRRDAWMAINLAKADKPILALLGNMHTLKKVVWSNTTGLPFVAGILNKQVKSYPQLGLSTECAKPLSWRFVPANTPEALELLNKHTFSLLNADEPDSAISVVDGVIVWECSV
ncbi:MAG TPA: hypothetical protein EYQ43_03555 [Methyloprofundus sp.]|nr:hypothetical protein [Methyloprofundus sp.]